MKVLLVGGWADGNKRWAEKARARFGVEVVGYWGEDKSKSPGKAPGGDYAAFFVLTDVCSHKYTDAAKAHAEKRGLGLFNVNTSITVSDGLLRKQGFTFPAKATAAAATVKNVPKRSRTSLWSRGELITALRLRVQGVTWRDTGLALGTTSDRIQQALRRIRQLRPADWAQLCLDADLPTEPPKPTRAAASDDVSEWVGLAEQYERERDAALGRVRQLGAANKELQDKFRCTNNTSFNQTIKIAGLQNQIADLRKQATTMIKGPPQHNGIDRDAFRLGIDAALRATGGDTTTRALLQIAGFDLTEGAA